MTSTIGGAPVLDEALTVGVIASSGGSALDCTIEVLGDLRERFRFAVVSDRECGVEEVASRWGLSSVRLTGKSNDEFSSSAATWLKDEHGAKVVLLYYSRLVSASLFRVVPCVNFHPSLLPAFPGMGSVAAQVQSTVRIVGATAHFVDESIDGGPIVAQVAALRPDGAGDARRSLERLQFSFKVYLTLALLERIAVDSSAILGGRLHEHSSEPAPELASMPLIDPELRLRFRTFIEQEKVPWRLDV